MSGPALAIMARAPVPGQVKTRFQPRLTPAQSADLYLAFLQDTLEAALSARTYSPFLFFTPAGAEPFFRQLVPPSVGLRPQGEGDLGQRMHQVFHQLGGMGYSPVVVIGSDLPNLQPVQLEKALVYLRHCDVCLGPSRDGGYYLVGTQGAHRGLFEGVPWGTAQVLEVTLARAKEAGLSLALLDVGADVDTIEDLRQLRLDIERLKRTPGSREPYHIVARLREISL